MQTSALNANHFPQLKAVLWDMDGTLVDTEPYWIAAEHGLVERFGGKWSHEQAMQLVGQSLVHSSKILQRAGVEMESREIIDHLSGEVIERIQQRVPWRPGARELLDSLYQADIRCAMVTMSERPMATVVAESLPEPYFEFLVTGDSVTHGKPHPEAYTTAVERLRRTDPELGTEHCVALEDSIPGIQAAVSSGLVTVGVPHVIDIPEGSASVLWDSLHGKDVHDLHAVLQDFRVAQAKAGSH
ncbi:HAD family hydrolase [Pseudarthrobacter sp. J1738]|uniref:HAD family hydrolase n=1 Tax=unclassified Pseudarthrobacter TaxID=2647000 RepID=UPI003D2660CF